MTSQKIFRGKISLLGSNILRGGQSIYSADVLGENWFDRRLAPGYKPRQASKSKWACQFQATNEEQLKSFNEKGRCSPTFIANQSHRTDTIPSWNPEEPCRGHEHVDDRFATIHNISYGDPVMTKKSIPVGRNILSNPLYEIDMMTTEHRESFKNPSFIAKNSSFKKDSLHCDPNRDVSVSDERNTRERASSEAIINDGDAIPAEKNMPGSKNPRSVYHPIDSPIGPFQEEMYCRYHKDVSDHHRIAGVVTTPTSYIGVPRRFMNPQMTREYFSIK